MEWQGRRAELTQCGAYCGLRHFAQYFLPQNSGSKLHIYHYCHSFNVPEVWMCPLWDLWPRVTDGLQSSQGWIRKGQLLAHSRVCWQDSAPHGVVGLSPQFLPSFLCHGDPCVEQLMTGQLASSA